MTQKKAKNIFKFSEIMFSGWSLTKLLLATSFLSILLAGMVQYGALSYFSSQVFELYHQEISKRLQVRLERFQPQWVKGIQARSLEILQKTSHEVALADPEYQMIQFIQVYDIKGKILFERKTSEQISEYPRSIPRNLPLIYLDQNKFYSQKVTYKGASFFDIAMSIEFQNDYQLKTSEKIGFVRVIAFLSEQTSKNLAISKVKNIHAWSVLLVVCTTILGSLLVFWVLSKTVSDPIERAVHFIHENIEDSNKVPEMEVKSTDAYQIKQLMHALYSGIWEIQTKHLLKQFIEKTKNISHQVKEEEYINNLRSIWLVDNMAEDCFIVIARQDSESKKFMIEKRSTSTVDSKNNHQISKNNENLKLKDVSRDEMIAKFLHAPQELAWHDKVLFVKRKLIGTNQTVYFVIYIVINLEILTPEKYEELLLLWSEEVVRIYQQVRYLDLSKKFELSRELRRFSNISRTFDKTYSKLILLHAVQSVFCGQTRGDFCFGVKIPRLSTSLTFIGEVVAGENTIRAGLCASQLLGIMEEIYREFMEDEKMLGDTLVKKILLAIHRHLYKTYRGYVYAKCLALSFNHQKTEGISFCYGSKAPLLLTPNERKPMAITSHDTSGIYLGKEDEISWYPTEFSLVPGQMVLLLSSDILDQENNSSTKLEKLIRTGALSDVTDNLYMEPAAQILDAYFVAIKKLLDPTLIDIDMCGSLIKCEITSSRSTLYS